MSTVIDCLEERGLLDALTTEELREKCKEPLTVYVGFDPTAESLHLGNMMTIMLLSWFQRYGHTPIAVVGGATGMIGDPGGKDEERPLLSKEEIERNLKGIRRNLEALLDFNHPTAPAKILNNFEWFGKIGYLDFLRDVGKHMRMGPMLSKDSVKTRLESESGMSYTEFSYQLLQGYDFLHLFDTHGVSLQMGGSDQWGNIIAGIDLVRKLRGESVMGLTAPLLTRSDGKKFGKSEKGAIWLSKDFLSPYDLYQHLYRMPDSDVIKLMKALTFMEMEEIRRFEQQMVEPGYLPNSAQKRLAEEITTMLHGSDELKVAQRVTQAAKPGAQTVLDVAVLESLGKEMPSYSCAIEEIVDQPVIDLLVAAGMTPSKGQARRLIRGGGVYLNNVQLREEGVALSTEDVIEGKLLLLSVGKKNKLLVRVH